MSIRVQHLTKQYGQQRAVDDISFEAKPGEVLGFLGPNGAGKTTTMKIITCYLTQSAGQVEVCGHDVLSDSLAVRRQIGYLPEHNPLYKDLYVKEYLQFAARISGLKKPTARIAELIDLTGLGREQHKQIGALSKGYRQRVGLAQAMLHDPKVLILDEPTSGLDPNQLAEIRGLIKTLGKEKTVVFSTHIMQEVQAICDRVIIIDQGKLVADDSIDRLQARLQGETVLLVEFNRSPSIEQLAAIRGVKKVAARGSQQFQLIVEGQIDARAEVFRFAVDQKLVLLGMQHEAMSVEDVFRQLTAKTATQ